MCHSCSVSTAVKSGLTRCEWKKLIADVPGTLFSAMSATETSQSIYTTGEYARENPSYHVEDSAWKADHILRMIHKHNLQPRTICEVGCGAGEILKQLQQALPGDVQFDGYEISPQAFALCQERANERLQFHCASLPPAPAPAFDLLLCIDVFEHVPDYIGFLKALRPKADRTIFHIPLDLSVQSVLRGSPIMNTRKQFGHLHYFTKDTALATLADCGYDIIDSSFTAVGAERGRGLKSLLAKWPRKILATLSHDLAARLLGGHSLLVLAK